MGYRLIKHLDSTQVNRKLFYMDTDADLPEIVNQTDISPGSEAKSIISGKTWVLNSEFQWVASKITEGGSTIAVPSPGGGGGTPFPEAPADGDLYGRKNADWEKLPIGKLTQLQTNEKTSLVGAINEVLDSIPEDALRNDKLFGRKNGAWVEVPAENLQSLRTTHKGSLVGAVNELKDAALSEAPQQAGVLFARKDNAWEPIALGNLAQLNTNNKTTLVAAINEAFAKEFSDAASDGQAYGRKDGDWFVLPLGDLATLKTTAKNTLVAAINELYDRSGTSAGIGEAPEDGAKYVRKDAEWVKLELANAEQLDSLTTTHKATLVGAINEVNEKIFADAPRDGSTYVRKDNAWEKEEKENLAALATAAKTSLVEAINELHARPSGTGGIGEAPNDGFGYVRKNEAWEKAVDNVGLEDAPSNANEYVRKGGNWVEMPKENLTELTTSAKESLVAAINEVNAKPDQQGIPDADSDSKYYARYNGAWRAFKPFTENLENLTTDAKTSLIDAVNEITQKLDDKVPEAPNDGKVYGRKENAWEPIQKEALDGLTTEAKDSLVNAINEINTKIFADAEANSKLYARKDGAWETFTPFTENLTTLVTEHKTTLVGAINELAQKPSGPSGLQDAAADGKLYGRKDNTWTVVPIGNIEELRSQSGDLVTAINQLHDELNEPESSPFLRDAPGDDSLYGRKNGAWAKVELGAAEDPRVGGLSDLKTTAKDNLVAAVNELFDRPKGIADVEEEGAYVRQSGAWKKFVGVTDVLPGLGTVSKTLPSAVNELNMVKIGDAPKDQNTYGRSNGAWVRVLPHEELNALKTVPKTVVGGINEVHDRIGSLNALQTTAKSSLVAAVNELKANTSSGNPTLGDRMALEATLDGVDPARFKAVKGFNEVKTFAQREVLLQDAPSTSRLLSTPAYARFLQTQGEAIYFIATEGSSPSYIQVTPFDSVAGLKGQSVMTWNGLWTPASEKPEKVIGKVYWVYKQGSNVVLAAYDPKTNSRKALLEFASSSIATDVNSVVTPEFFAKGSLLADNRGTYLRELTVQNEGAAKWRTVASPLGRKFIIYSPNATNAVYCYTPSVGLVRVLAHAQGAALGDVEFTFSGNGNYAVGLIPNTSDRRVIHVHLPDQGAPTARFLNLAGNMTSPAFNQAQEAKTVCDSGKYFAYTSSTDIAVVSVPTQGTTLTLLNRVLRTPGVENHLIFTSEAFNYFCSLERVNVLVRGVNGGNIVRRVPVTSLMSSGGSTWHQKSAAVFSGGRLCVIHPKGISILNLTSFTWEEMPFPTVVTQTSSTFTIDRIDKFSGAYIFGTLEKGFVIKTATGHFVYIDYNKKRAVTAKITGVSDTYLGGVQPTSSAFGPVVLNGEYRGVTSGHSCLFWHGDALATKNSQHGSFGYVRKMPIVVGTSGVFALDPVGPDVRGFTSTTRPHLQGGLE